MIAAGVVGALALATAGYLWTQRGNAPAGSAAVTAMPKAAGSATTGATPGEATGASAGAAMAPCATTSTVAVPAAYLRVWTSVAADFARSSDASTCTPIAIVARASAEVAAGGAAVQDLDGWIPEDLAWADRLTAQSPTAVSGTPTMLASTPIVLAMPTPMAHAAGVGTGTFSPATLRDLITLTKTWADLGHPEWGTLRVALPDPRTSVTGALGFTALSTIATDGQLPTTIDYANPTPAQLAVIRVEHRVAATAPDDAAVLDALGPLSARVGATDPGGPGAWVTTEAALLSASGSAAAADRIAIPLGTGAAADRQALVRLGRGSGSVLDAFTAYLSGSSGAAAMTRAGLRVGASGPPADRLAAAGISMPPALAAPNQVASADIWRSTTTFTMMHVRLSSLVALDCSGSMTATFPGTTVRKIDLVAALAKQTLSVASPQARSGLVTFQTDRALEPKIVVAAQVMANGVDDNGMPHANRVLDAVTSAPIGGGTPLFEAIRQGYRAALAAWDPGYVNQLVVLTDGSNRDSSSRLTRAALLRELAAMSDPKRPIKVILLGYGRDADLATLQAIASATGGKAVPVPSIESVADATREALFTP